MLTIQVRFQTVNEEFYVGPPGSGAPVHYHYAAWNALVFGSKAWVLFEPRRSAFSNVPAAFKVKEFANEDFLKEANSSDRHLRCVQRAGDVILVPNGWAHLTYNLAASIGVAKEFLAMPTGGSRFSKSSRAAQHLQEMAAAKAKPKPQIDATKLVRTGRIDAGGFIRSVEDEGMTPEVATAKFLDGFPHEAVIKLLNGAVRNVAQRATRVAAKAVCPSASEVELESLLAVHRSSCWFSSQLREIVNNAFLTGDAVAAPPLDFKTKCSPRCMNSLRSLVDQSIQKQLAPRTSNVAEVSRVFIGLCGPVFDALLDSCGHRGNVTFWSASEAAQDFARAGALDVVLKMLERGYNIFTPIQDATFDHGLTIPFSNPLASIFIRAGYADHAARLIEAYPEFGAHVDTFGTPAHELLVSHTALPPKLSAADTSGVSYGSGGWPSTHELKFPGWKQIKDENEQCDGIAELSGQDVSENPEWFIREYVLKDLPAVVRDFVRHDLGLSPLIDLFKRAAVSRIPSTFDAGVIPYARSYSKSGRVINNPILLSDFIARTVNISAATNAEQAPPYIFANSLKLGSDQQRTRVAELYPHLPLFIEEGLGGRVRLEPINEQFYFGGPASGAPQHIHNYAFNALVYGRKAWIITRPHQSSFSVEPALEMVRRVAEDDAANDTRQHLRCVQRSGDMMFVPRMWGHMTFNLATSIGKAVEFNVYSLLAPPSDDPHGLGKGRINVGELVTAMEEGSDSARAYGKILKGHSHQELMASALGSVAALAPRAVFAAASVTGACASSSDLLVEKLLSKSLEACENTALFGRMVVNDAILMQKIGHNAPDFKLKCGPRCLKLFEKLLNPVAHSYKIRGEIAAPVSERDHIYRRLCTPVVHAILDACGQRNGTNGHRIAQELLSSGNLPAVLKMGRLGYSLYDSHDPGKLGTVISVVSVCCLADMYVYFGYLLTLIFCMPRRKRATSSAEFAAGSFRLFRKGKAASTCIP
jgi:hypothetical protein